MLLETPTMSIIVKHCIFERTIPLSFFQIQPITCDNRGSIIGDQNGTVPNLVIKGIRKQDVQVCAVMPGYKL